jgi:hypothetical protein
MSATDSSRPGLPRLAAVAAQIQAEQPTRLRDALELTQAALEAVDPEAATVRALDGVDLGFEKMAVVALGKAAPAMARGAARALDTSARSILVVTDHDAAVPVGTELIVSSHPVPDGRSLAAGRRLLEVVERSELPVLFLISGGGSALAEVPARRSEPRRRRRHLPNDAACQHRHRRGQHRPGSDFPDQRRAVGSCHAVAGGHDPDLRRRAPPSPGRLRPHPAVHQHSRSGPRGDPAPPPRPAGGGGRHPLERSPCPASSRGTGGDGGRREDGGGGGGRGR